MARFVVRSSSSVLADGSHVRDSLDELIGFDSGAELRPMGVWLELFQSVGKSVDVGPLPRHYILFVGRLVEKKGVEYLIKAMPRVRDSVEGMELVIVGDGVLGAQLHALTEALGLERWVHFVGAKTHDEVAALLQRAEVATVPSIIDSRGETEGMPTVVLEAMASGARVVGTRVNGIPDVLEHAENGWLVEPKDEVSLAAGLIAAATDPRGDDVAEAGSNTAARHDWSTVGREYMEVLIEAVS